MRGLLVLLFRIGFEMWKFFLLVSIILQLPLNIWTLSEAERKARLEMRKPKSRVQYQDDLDDSYDANKYLKYIQKKK